MRVGGDLLRRFPTGRQGGGAERRKWAMKTTSLNETKKYIV